MDNVPDETNIKDHVLNDFPSFSLGVEFKMSGGKNDVEVPLEKIKSIEKNDKVVYESEKAVKKVTRK